MSTTTVDAFVESIFSLAEAEGVLAQVESEFSSVVRAIDSSDDLRSKLNDELLPSEVRQQIVEKLLEGKAHRLTTQLIALVIGSGHSRSLRTIALCRAAPLTALSLPLQGR